MVPEWLLSPVEALVEGLSHTKKIININRDFEKILNEQRTPKRPELWDGHAAERCLRAILNFKE